MAGDWIGAKWRDYRTKVIPLEAPDIQARECRRAFYAGARALLGIMIAKLEGGIEPTEADLRMMAEIHAELERFKDGVAEGQF